MFNNLKGWEWLIIVALILLLFGAKRLPDAARGLGRSLRIFKAETKGLTEDSAKEPSAPASAPSPALGASSSSAAAAEAAPAEAPKPTEA